MSDYSFKVLALITVTYNTELLIIPLIIAASMVANSENNKINKMTFNLFAIYIQCHSQCLW